MTPVCMYVCMYVCQQDQCMHAFKTFSVCLYACPVCIYVYAYNGIYVCMVWFAIFLLLTSSSLSFCWRLRREYADNVKQTKQTGTANKLVVNNQRRNLPDAVYGYQQWNIIKKNKFGIRQDRCVHTEIIYTWYLRRYIHTYLPTFN